MFGSHANQKKLLHVIAAFSVCILLSACGGNEQGAGTMQEGLEQADEAADPIASGRETYMQYCASCHGPEGEGEGPVADVMTAQPADLTQLRAQYGGTFPTDSIYAFIDGRADVQAHGTREMPVWGNVWGEVDGQPVPREEVDLRIRELVEYIRTLQDEPAGT